MRRLTFLIIFLGISALLNAQSISEKKKAVENHAKAIHVMDDWMRDPFIELADDGYYYLSCTRQNTSFPNELAAMQFWRSKDLVEWEDLGIGWEAKNCEWGKALIEKGKDQEKKAMIWAPEIHQINGRWVIVNTSNQGIANLFLTKGDKLEGPFDEPFGLDFGRHHDPSIFMDDDGTPWLVAKCAELIKMKKDFSGFDGEPIAVGPSNRKMGHEGCYIIKVDGKYILFELPGAPIPCGTERTICITALPIKLKVLTENGNLQAVFLVTEHRFRIKMETGGVLHFSMPTNLHWNQKKQAKWIYHKPLIP